MAYYLSFDGVNDRVRCPIPPAVNTDWEFRLRVRSRGDTVGVWVEDDRFTALFAITPDGGINIKSRNTLVQFTHNVDITDGFHLYTLKYAGGVLTARIDGVTMGTTTDITFFSWDLDDATHFNIGSAYRSTGSVFYRDMDFDFFEIWHHGEIIRRWDSPSSNGTGSVLPETAVGDDGVLLNFTSDDSQWVYFDGVSINPSEYARKVELTGLSPAAPLTGYVALISEDNVPAEFWTTAQYGGGDVRVSLNTDGTGQLPIEVVTCDTANQKFRMFVRFPTYTDLDRGCWLFYGKPGEYHHADSSSFGKHTVWQDYWLVVHGITTLYDSTANNWDPVVVQGNPLPSLDKGVQLTNGNKLDYDTPNLGVTDLTVSSIVNVEWYHGLIIGSGSTKGGTLFTTRGSTTNLSPTLVVTEVGNKNMNTGFIADGDSLAAGSDSTHSHPTGVDFAIAGTVDRDSTGGKFDGTWTGYDDERQNSANNVSLGGNNLGSNGFVGGVSLGRHPEWGNESSVHIKYLQVAKEAFPAEKVLLSQANQKNPDTFWTTGTPVDASEGATGGNIIDVNAAQSQVLMNSETLSISMLQNVMVNTPFLFLETEQNTVGQFVSLASAESQMLLESVTLDISNSLALASVESELYIDLAPVVAQQVVSLSAASSELVLASEVQAVAQSINLDAALAEIHVATEQNTVGQFVSLSSVSSEAEVFAPAISTTSQVPVSTVSSEATIFSPAVSSASQIPVESIDTQLRINTVPITLEAENAVTAITSYLDINTETGIPGYISNVAINPAELPLETESNTVGYQVAIASVASEAVLNSATLTLEQSISITAIATESDIKTVPASLDTASALVTVTTESLVESQVLEAGQEIQLFAVSSESLVESETVNLSGELRLVAVAVESRLESETGIPGYQQDIDAVAVESPIQVETLTLDAAIDLNVVISETLIETPTSAIDTLSDISPVVSELLLQTETLNLGALITVNAVKTESLLDINIIEIIQQNLDTGDAMIQPITTLTRFVLAPKTRIYKLTMK